MLTELSYRDCSFTQGNREVKSSSIICNDKGFLSGNLNSEECIIGKKGNFLWGTFSGFNRDVKLPLDTRAAKKENPCFTQL